jgi:outer membrane receptor protein involved in Fe transport
MRTLLTVLAILFALASLPPAAAQAQTADGNGRIEGRVVDAASENPLSGATVSVRNPADSTLVTGTATDSSGAFAIDDVPYGTYTLRISFVGFATKHLTDVRIARQRQERELGAITLSEKTAQLQEVTVSAERPAMEVQTDRTVYNTSEQIVTAGGSARAVLQDLPSIQVDIDGSISYRGSEGVVVHINGEPTSLSGQSLANFLQSLPASSVERVEVIPNPSAKYEPEGSAGIINIVLKRNRSAGWSGGFTAGGGTNQSYSLSGNLGYQNGPWRLFTNYGFRGGSEDEGGDRLRRNLTENPTEVLDQSSTENESDRGHTLNTQAEYRPSDATSFSAETVLSMDSGNSESRRNTIFETINGTLLDRYARLTEEDGSEQSADARLSMSHDFAPDDHNLEAELRYESEWEDEDGSYREFALTEAMELGERRQRERENMGEREQEGSFELDYVRPLGRFDLEAGYRGEWSMEDNDQAFEIFNDGTDTWRTEEVSSFDFEEQTHAAYALLTTPLSSSFDLKVGARAEQAITTFTLPARDDAYDNNYFSIFPSAYLTFKPSEQYQARLSYSKRVRRPNSWQLNPIDDNEDPNFRRVGNPQLDPEYVHAFELSLTRKWTPVTLSVNPFFRRTVNEIERRRRYEDNVTITEFANFASSNSYGLEVVTSLQMEDWVRGNISLNAHRVVTDGSNFTTDRSNDAMEYSGRTNLTFSLGSGVALQLSQFYRAPLDIAGGRLGAFTSSDIALQKELFDGQGSLSLRASDVFDTMNFSIQQQLNGRYTQSTYDWSQRQIMLTFSYSFGANDQRGGRR